MDVYTDTIRNLPAADRLRLVERIWDGLAEEPIPLPDWALKEASRRRDELLADPSLGVTHDDMWRRINDSRNG
jgi:putative addiction module component (TIGR02574 family)